MDQARQIRVGVRRGELEARVKQIDRLVGFAMLAAEVLGRHLSALGHMVEHALNLAGAHQFFEERVEHRLVARSSVTRTAEPKSTKPTPCSVTHHIVEAKIQMQHAGCIMHRLQQIHRLHGEFQLRQRRAAIAQASSF